MDQRRMAEHVVRFQRVVHADKEPEKQNRRL
jgi:hypothetical protein